MRKRIRKIIAAVMVFMMVIGTISVGKSDKVYAADVSGRDIVSCARQYVGKVPYVYGGTSLTTGADCSGFICRIYEQFGINLWPYRTALRNAGTNIGTDLNQAIPGDIIWFQGHVGIYAGIENGQHMLVDEEAGNKMNVCYVKIKDYTNYGMPVLGIIRIPGVVDVVNVFTGNIDTPTAGSVYSNQDVQISGWSEYTQGVGYVILTVNGMTFNTSIYGSGNRMGYEGVVPQYALAEGDNTITAHTYCNGQEVGTNSVTIQYKNSGSQTIADGIYTIESALNNNCVLNVYNNGISNETNVTLHSKTNENNQKFKVKYEGNGYYSLRSVSSAKMLDVRGGYSGPEVNIWMWEDNSASAQRYIIKDAGDGYYYLITGCSGMYVDVYNGDTADDTNIWTYTGNGSAAQKWKFVPSEITVSDDGWTYSNILPDDTDKYDIEYLGTQTVKSASSPGDGWTQGSVAATNYTENGGTYETIFPQTTSNTVRLVRYYYYHYCGANAGSNANYEASGNFVHYCEISNPDSVVEAGSYTDKDNGSTYYNLKWTDGTSAKCKTGVTCDSTYGTHAARSSYWYKRYVYQNYTEEIIYNWYKDASWTSEKPEGDSRCRYKVKKVQEELKSGLSYTVTGSKVSQGDKVTFTAEAAGGSGDYTYKFIVYNKTTKQWGKLQDFSSSNTYVWTAGAAGDRDFYVDVKDSTGKVVRSSVNVVIESTKPTAQLTPSATTVTAGNKLTLTASTNKSGCTYKFLIYNPSTNQWFKLQDFGSKSTYTWTAGSAGTRQFYVDVKDSDGNVTRSKVVNVTIGSSGALSVKTTVSANTSKPGDKITFTASASGGNAGYTYKMVVYNKTTKTWGLVQNFNANNKITWTAGSAGDREFYIDVKDANGNVVRSSVMNVKTGN